MGVILPRPILSKVVERCGSPIVAGGCCSINGYRSSMEDSHCMLEETSRYVFGVFDGHGSDRCSQYVAEHLPRKLRGLPDPIDPADLERICLELDLDYIESVGEGGSTAAFCILERPSRTHAQPTVSYRLHIGNVGDSRVLICRDGLLVYSTVDHKPHTPAERARIEAHNGVVRSNRVDGDLAVSRAFGDATFKRGKGSLREQKVIAVPDVDVEEVRPGDVLIVACDGVFEGSFTNEEVVAFVQANLPEAGGDYAVTAARVCDMAVRRGSKDNISCMIVHLADGTHLRGQYGASSFVPGPPFLRTHEASRVAYQRMAEIANVTLEDALQKRHSLFVRRGDLSAFPPIDRVAFDMCDDVELQTEAQFWGTGPSNDPAGYFAAMAEGR